ncbi:MAG: radical SAM family heme chaperone HemW [Cytophagales bacterium]
MAGIYLHIPFCKQACHYCDFHFSTSIGTKSALVNALVKEIGLQKAYLDGEIVETIYFGGGTPSMLDISELALVLNSLYCHFNVAQNAEITLEANPDDINIEKLLLLKSLNINRLSIGIQTFDANFLKWMNRAHNAQQAIEALHSCFDAGFANISIDLMYGLPAENHSILENDLDTILKYKIPHISAYNLTIEPQTAFGKLQKNGKLAEASNEFAAVQMQMLIDRLVANDFIHYETSNFAKEGHFSKHNTAYWLDKKYVGIGPSAHSYNRTSRQFNVSNNGKYIQAIEQNKIPFEIEILTEKDKANEFIMTGLRTSWGLDLEKIDQLHSLKKEKFELGIAKYIELELAITDGNYLKLTSKGKFYADKVASELFFD